jgi:hypothetical protein
MIKYFINRNRNDRLLHQSRQQWVKNPPIKTTVSEKSTNQDGCCLNSLNCLSLLFELLDCGLFVLQLVEFYNYVYISLRTWTCIIFVSVIRT